MSNTIRHVTAAELRARIDAALKIYPWFEDYPIDCHSSCARWEIAAEHGGDAGDAWHEYDAARWLLTGKNAGRTTDE
ncbi:MAG: hypothetical protein WCP30_18445 [Mycobacteriaceae bacterium]